MKKGFFLLAVCILASTFIATSTSFAASPMKSAATSMKYGRHVFWKPGQQPAVHAAASASNLNYGGGSVMAGTANIYAIFWQPTNNVSPAYHALVQQYFNDIGGSSIYQSNTQYHDSNGMFPSNSRLAGIWTDTSGYPNNPILDVDIQNEVNRAMSVNGWSAGVDNGFFVFTERGANVCFDRSHSQCASNAFCAYHGAFGNGVIYAEMPYAASFNCGSTLKRPNNDDADLTIQVTSHEQMEAATDPYPNSGWVDPGGLEIGDKCAWTFGPMNSDGSDIVLNGHPYVLQREWSNTINNCTMGSGGYYKIANRQSGRVLDVAGVSTANGAQVWLWDYLGGANQQWQLNDVGNGYISLVSRNTGKVLDASGGGTANGTETLQWDYLGGANQQWQIVNLGNGYDEIVNRNSGTCLDADTGTINANGTKVQIWSYAGNINQQWQLIPV